MNESDIANYFTYHPPHENQVHSYRELRQIGKDVAYVVNNHCPDSREKSTAIAKLRECIMWANAAIACNPKDGE